MCGAHAQVMSAAEVSVALRVGGVTRVDVRRALWEDRSLVKTIGPRGTVHLLPADDLPTWNAALATAVEPSNFAADVRLNAAQLDAVIEAIDSALSESDRTLEELDAEVARRTGPWAGDKVMPAFQILWPRWRQAIQRAAFRGVMCFGPNRGTKVTYSSPRRWLPEYQPADPEAASLAVLRAYLHAYGPARSEHVARWINSSPAWARERSGGPETNSSRSTSRARGCGSSPVTRRRTTARVASSGSYRTSTPTPSGATRATASSRAEPGSARSPARRPGTSRYCSSTTSLPASGTSADRAGVSQSWSRRSVA